MKPQQQNKRKETAPPNKQYDSSRYLDEVNALSNPWIVVTKTATIRRVRESNKLGPARDPEPYQLLEQPKEISDKPVETKGQGGGKSRRMGDCPVVGSNIHPVVHSSARSSSGTR